jgi:hypothetical protein
MKAGGGGAIINFASEAGTEGHPGRGAYAAAKEAIRGITKVAAMEWGVFEADLFVGPMFGSRWYAWPKPDRVVHRRRLLSV